MKKSIFLFVLAVFTGVSVLLAQGPQPRDPAERAKATIERLKPELTLTEQQQKDMTPVYTDFYKELQALMQNGERPAPEDRRKLMDQRNEKLKKILSEDQMKKLAEAEEKMRAQRRQNSGGNQ